MSLCIVIDAVGCVAGRTGGIETYVTELVRALATIRGSHRLVVLAQPSLRRLLAGVDVDWMTPPRAARSLGEAFWMAQRWVPFAARRAGADVVHHTKNYGALGVSAAQLVTLHDLFPHYFLTHGQTQRLRNAAQLALMVASARAADHVITVSEATRAHIASVTRLPKERLTAVPIAPKPLIGTARRGDGYFLAVAKNAPYKNLLRLVRAHGLSGVHRPLLLAGVAGWRQDGTARELAAAVTASHGRVRSLGFVPEDELAALYGGARAVVCPSLIEGFGLAPLEAASLGVPVAMSAIAAHREVMGDDAALSFDPLSEESIASALQRLERDDLLCRTLTQAGLARARRYSWQATARRTLEVYEEATHRKGRVTFGARAAAGAAASTPPSASPPASATRPG